MKKRAQKRLYKIYNKRLKKLHKQNFAAITNNLDYFVTYLQYLRDYYILNEPLVIDGHDNMKIATLVTALVEYHAYKDCILKYYSVSGTDVRQIVDGPKDEIAAKYNAEKAVHWKYFWQIVMLNIEDWRLPNATV